VRPYYSVIRGRRYRTGRRCRRSWSRLGRRIVVLEGFGFGLGCLGRRLQEGRCEQEEEEEEEVLYCRLKEEEGAPVEAQLEERRYWVYKLEVNTVEDPSIAVVHFLVVH